MLNNNFIKKQTDSPGVIAPPPLIYLTGFIIGTLLHYIKPLKIFGNNFIVPIALTMIIISIFIFIIAIRFFMKMQTNLNPSKPTTFIIMNGPYRFSRNPIYLSMAFFYLGIATLVNDIWIVVMLIPVLFIIQYGVIIREERYLTKKFGDKYIKYKKSINRWL